MKIRFILMAIIIAISFTSVSFGNTTKIDHLKNLLEFARQGDGLSIMFLQDALILDSQITPEDFGSKKEEIDELWRQAAIHNIKKHLAAARQGDFWQIILVMDGLWTHTNITLKEVDSNQEEIDELWCEAKTANEQFHQYKFFFSPFEKMLPLNETSETKIIWGFFENGSGIWVEKLTSLNGEERYCFLFDQIKKAGLQYLNLKNSNVYREHTWTVSGQTIKELFISPSDSGNIDFYTPLYTISSDITYEVGFRW